MLGSYLLRWWLERASYRVTIHLVVSGRCDPKMLVYYQDKLSGGVFTAAAFILRFLFSHSKPTIAATITTSRSRRVMVTPVATEAASVVGTAKQID